MRAGAGGLACTHVSGNQKGNDRVPIGASFCTHPPYFVGTPPPVGGLPPRWTGPPLRSVALSAAGGVTTDPPLGRCPCREPLKRSLSLLLANRHGRFEIADFHYENQSRSQAPRRLSSPRPEQARPHTYMWSIYAVAGLVLLAVALYKLWQRSSSPQYARIVPSDDYDDLPDLIDTSPPPSPGSSASESPKRQRMAIDGRRFWSNSVNRDMLRVARGQSYAGNMICLAPGLHVSKFSRGQS